MIGRTRRLDRPLTHRPFQLRAGDLALGQDAAIQEHDRHAPVVEVVQAIVGVDVSELGLVTEGTQVGEGLVAEVTALPGDEDQRHLKGAVLGPGVALTGQFEGLPHLDRRPL